MNKQVLVFVSSDTNGHILRSLLGRAGAQVTTASQREEVLACLLDVEEGQGTPQFNKRHAHDTQENNVNQTENNRPGGRAGGGPA